MRTPKLPEIPAVEEAPRRSEEKGEKEKLDEKACSLNATAADPPRKKNAEEDEFEALAKRFEALKKR